MREKIDPKCPYNIGTPCYNPDKLKPNQCSGCQWADYSDQQPHPLCPGECTQYCCNGRPEKYRNPPHPHSCKGFRPKDKNLIPIEPTEKACGNCAYLHDNWQNLTPSHEICIMYCNAVHNPLRELKECPKGLLLKEDESRIHRDESIIKRLGVELKNE